MFSRIKTILSLLVLAPIAPKGTRPGVEKGPETRDLERRIDEADALRAEAASIPAVTIEGLRCKARMLSDAELGCLPDGLADSIIADLMDQRAA